MFSSKMLVNHLFVLMAMSVGISSSPSPRQLLLKKILCGCTCCKEAILKQHNNREDVIGVSPECIQNPFFPVPFGLQCPLEECEGSNKRCGHWNQEKCDTACLCSQCPNSTDARCQDWNPNVVPGPRCQCKPLLKPPFCGSKFLFDLFQNPAPELTCTIKCICSSCYDPELNATLHGIDRVCSRIPADTASNCTCLDCPQLLYNEKFIG